MVMLITFNHNTLKNRNRPILLLGATYIKPVLHLAYIPHCTEQSRQDLEMVQIRKHNALNNNQIKNSTFNVQALV